MLSIAEGFTYIPQSVLFDLDVVAMLMLIHILFDVILLGIVVGSVVSSGCKRVNDHIGKTKGCIS